MKKVLLVVDMLNDFICLEGALSLGESGVNIVPVIRGKLEQARANGDVIIFLCDRHPEWDLEFNRFPKHALEGSWGADIISSLEPGQDEFVLSKTRYSGFFETKLDELLRDFEPTVVEVVGCCTSICIAQTVADLANRDYNVIVDKTAVADFNQDAHDFYINYQLPNIFGAVIV